VLDGAVTADDELLAEALAANLYEDLLPAWDDDWLVLERERHRQLRLHALENLSARLSGEAGATRRWWRRWRPSPGSRCGRARTAR
jgi:hypothetical protein